MRYKASSTIYQDEVSLELVLGKRKDRKGSITLTELFLMKFKEGLNKKHKTKLSWMRYKASSRNGRSGIIHTATEYRRAQRSSSPRELVLFVVRDAFRYGIRRNIQRRRDCRCTRHIRHRWLARLETCHRPLTSRKA